MSDTLPANIKSVDITKDNQVIIIYNNNTAEKITKTEAIERGVINNDKTGIGFNNDNVLKVLNLKLDSILYFIDGKASSKSELNKLNPNEIDSINVFKGENATDKYGNGAEKGAVEFLLKKRNAAAGRDIIFQKTEEAPAFPGGEAEWRKYISSSINKVIDSLQAENKSGIFLGYSLLWIRSAISAT